MSMIGLDFRAFYLRESDLKTNLVKGEGGSYDPNRLISHSRRPADEYPWEAAAGQ
ncbi:hypothetical protein DY000_02063099 [Brassica cretica]|uniref:Uncharacterized protein n=1 Tax=Brassica cretica TaxID=69181 RepID=A0ABQ7AMB6_BRACR|nr:hypothetical protein DY000_02063099 [Brassica cretica]